MPQHPPPPVTATAPASEGGAFFGEHFLIAMPSTHDGWFAKSVVYVCEHSERGALGLVINKAADLDWAELFEKVGLQLDDATLGQRQVYLGGPVHTERGFVLHEKQALAVRGAPPLAEPHSAHTSSAQPTPYASTVVAGEGLDLTTSRDVLEAIAGGAGPKRTEIFLGYAAWGPQQLESEMAENAWLSVLADADLIFTVPVQERYAAALALLGINEWALSGQVGHG